MFTVAIIIILFFSPILVFSENIHMADDHAPISVMSDHIHKKGEFMMSFRTSSMEMSGLYNGNSSVSISDSMSLPNGSSTSKGTYMNAPTSMSMTMYMFGGMYAPSNNLTLLLMGNYQQKEMTQERMAMSGGARFDVNSQGFGDLVFGGLLSVKNKNDIKMHIGSGISFPTGSINQRDASPVSSDARLGYRMQNGSGTFDPYFLLNTIKESQKVKFGSQLSYKIRLGGNNDNGYHYGNLFQSKFWFSYSLVNHLSSSFKVTYKNLAKMNGKDNEMNTRMSPVMDAGNNGFQKILLGFGLNFINNQKRLKGHRLGFEFIKPVFQKFNRIQMSEDYRLVLGWQYAF